MITDIIMHRCRPGILFAGNSARFTDKKIFGPSLKVHATERGGLPA